MGKMELKIKIDYMQDGEKKLNETLNVKGAVLVLVNEETVTKSVVGSFNGEDALSIVDKLDWIKEYLFLSYKGLKETYSLYQIAKHAGNKPTE